MTTGEMVLDSLPLALAPVPTNTSAKSRQQIGWLTVGSMRRATLLTVFVVPTVYTLLASKKVTREITAVEQGEVAQVQTSPQVVGGAGD